MNPIHPKKPINPLNSRLVLIKGAGDLASGVAHRLMRNGLAVVMTEQARPTVVRRLAAFAEAVYEKEQVVEGVRACLIEEIGRAQEVLVQGDIPILVDPQARLVMQLTPRVIVDAIMAKQNTGTRICDAPLVIALGPGFTAGRDAHAVVETQRGPDLGRVLWAGSAHPDTGIPAPVQGFAAERVIRAPASGIFQALVSIGDPIQAGGRVGRIDNRWMVEARITGVIRGLIRGGLHVSAGLKLGDIDPGGDPQKCRSISDKARAVAGGVWRAITAAEQEAAQIAAQGRL